MTISISEKVDFRKRNTIKYKKVYLIMINGLIHQEAIDKHAPFNKASNCEGQNLTDLKRQIGKSTIVVGDFNTPLSIFDRIGRKIIFKGIEDLYNTMNQFDLIGIDRTLPPIIAESTFFPSVNGAINRTDHMLG